MGVLGIGGLFFRARDPEALASWYREHLNVGAGCVADGAGERDEWSWMVQGGPVVFAPFAANTDYFPAEKQFMLNLRVSDMAGLIAAVANNHIGIVGIAPMSQLEVFEACWTPTSASSPESTTPKAIRSNFGSRRANRRLGAQRFPPGPMIRNSPAQCIMFIR